MPGLRVLAYNVHGFRAGVSTVARAVASERPDVALLNEARGRLQLRRFARALGMDAFSGLRLFRGIPNAVLLRPPWRAVAVEPVRFSREGRLIPRGVLVVRARRAGLPVTVMSAHLGLSDPERVRHARELTDLMAGLPPPRLLGVDLNEEPHHPAAAWVSARMFDAHAVAGEPDGATYPARDPVARIDYIFVSPDVRVVRCWVGRSVEATEASDHLPLFADVLVGEGDASA